MSEHLRELLHKAHELHELTEHLTSALIARNYEMASVDISKINANTDEIKRIATAAQAGDSAAIQEAVAAQLETDQAAVDAAASDQAAALAALTAEFPPQAPPTALAVSPTSITSAPGAAISQTLGVTGGTPPYSFRSDLADVSVDASGNVSGSPANAETGTITVSDSASASVPVSVTIA